MTLTRLILTEAGVLAGILFVAYLGPVTLIWVDARDEANTFAHVLAHGGDAEKYLPKYTAAKRRQRRAWLWPLDEYRAMRSRKRRAKADRANADALVREAINGH